MSRRRNEDRPCHLIADLLPALLLHPDRSKECAQAYQHGDIEGLYCWERDAIEYLIKRRDKPGYYPLNAWTAHLVDKVIEFRNAEKTTWVEIS